MIYHSLSDLVKLCEEKKVPIWRVVLESEMQTTGRDESEIYSRLGKHFEVMEKAAYKAIGSPLVTPGNLISGIAKTQHVYACSQDTICGGFLNDVMAQALSCSEVNASMGKICAAPTAGSCGILPAVLQGLRKSRNISLEMIMNGLLTASGIGSVITEKATISGAEGGCQAECGTAAAMAAAAAVEMTLGTPVDAIHAAGLALINAMGLICDPVAGLVQVPCALRNASQSVNALISADLARAGMRCIIPPDEIIDAMYRVGKSMPAEHKETAQGGLAATKTGKQIASVIFHKGELNVI